VIYLFPVGEAFWAAHDVDAAVREAAEASRRIDKGLDALRETARLAVALRTIEQAAIANCSNPRILGDSEVGALIAQLSVIGSVRLPFLKPPQLNGIAPGFVLASVPFAEQAERTAQVRISRVKATSAGVAAPLTPKSLPVDKNGRARLLESRIQAASMGDDGVALGNCRHVDITTTLRSFLHTSDAAAPFCIRFIYKDGTIGGSVRLRELPTCAPRQFGVRINAAVESCRHFDLDSRIDIYVLRNSDVARRDDARIADQEALAYGHARQLLSELCGTAGLHLHLFHTGLEPAVIGCYRAVIDGLLAGLPLKVTPVFFSQGKDEEPWE
jgi:hypothetical protein